ncbi:MAG: N-acetylmuramoyl-L-alanine amidase [Bacteroidetes bacterium]|nr:N-acetylmuramoyl-L-alanine amidase [Bacteroidota bacterium]
MRNKLIISFSALFFILLFTSSTPIHSSKIYAQSSILKTIVIDPGHGLPDPGAQGAYSNESDIALAIALQLGKKIQEALPMCKVVYTRTDRNLPNGLTDKNAANRYRAKLANDVHGDLYISIHANDYETGRKKVIDGYHTEKYYSWSGKGSKRKKVWHTRKVADYHYEKLPGTINGTETYIWAMNKNDDKVKFANDSKSEFAGNDDSSYQYDSPEAKILANLRVQKYFDNSKSIAEFVQEEMGKIGRVNLGVKQRDWEGIWVLQATAMPSILVETGFICTPSEEAYLNSVAGQNEMANSILNAIIRYKAKLENINNSTLINTINGK